MKIRTRFAPSPTGNLHLGSIRTALYSWLWARHNGGEFILRIEDTDRERSTQASTQLILDSMAWLGLDYDQGPYYQSERLEIYQKAAEQLLEKGLAYRCCCSQERINELREKQLANKEKPRYDGYCRAKNLPPTKESHVIRFKNAHDGEVIFEDQVLGKLIFKNSELDDLVIIKSEGFPTYNFCVVVDDLAMEISHVIRGADHINNTPRQINIFRALGATPPIYGHVPLILGSDGRLLSKRSGALSVLQYREEGFVKEALLNYLIRLGWSHGDLEIFSLEDMIRLFDVRDINRAAAAFNSEKLLWLNRHYIKTMEPREIIPSLSYHLTQLGIDHGSESKLEDVVVALRERSSTMKEMADKSRCFYEDFSTYAEDAGQYLNGDIEVFIKTFAEIIEKLQFWHEDKIHEVLEEVAGQFSVKFGKIAQPIRVAVVGTTISPPLPITIYLIGKDRVLKRLAMALSYIRKDQ
jgi:glutamyl-tRNA synthetase